MNINQLFKSMMPELQAGDAKKLELKVGQIVRGVVLQLLADQEALVNIGGVQVRAKLETPLRQGQSTMLQVQPESSSSQIVLKPLFSSTVQIADESMNALLRSLGVKDTPEQRMLLQLMHREGIPVSKGNVQTFQSALPDVPASGKGAEQWLQAAIVAFKRGLPVTGQTIGPIHQVLFGTPLHESLQQLGGQVAVLQQSGQAPETVKPQLEQLSALLRLLTGTEQTRPDAGAARPAPSPGSGGPMPNGAAGSPAHAAPLAGSHGAAPGQPPAAAVPAAASTAGTASPAPAPGHTAGQEAAARANPLPAQLQAAGSTPPQAPVQAEQPPARAVQAEAGVRGPQPPSPQAEGRPPMSPPQQADSAQPSPPQAAVDRDSATWVRQLQRWMGMDHEHQLVRLPAQQQAPGPASPPTALPSSLQEQAAPDPGMNRAAPAVNPVQAPEYQESVKSLLLQLVRTDDLPPALKDNAQQLLQQLTGQQLLLAADRTSPFTQLTLFLPIFGGQGEQTAAVHIQSRKNAKGDLDAENCRLLFDLNMQTLGATLVDVQIVNKWVSIQVHNDHAVIKSLLEHYRTEIAAGLESAGYQLSALKCAALPAPAEPEQTGGAGTGPARASLASAYGMKPYKGVDIRV